MACGKSKGETVSFGTLGINGPGVAIGNVPLNGSRLYTLGGIVSSTTGTISYTVRAEFFSGDLQLAVYTSQAAFENHEAPVTLTQPQNAVASYPTSTGNFYCEADFDVGPADPSGNYVVVLTTTNPGINKIDNQQFYDLRLMSSNAPNALGTSILPIASSPTTTTFTSPTGTGVSGSISTVDALTVYTTEAISSGTYMVSLISSVSTTPTSGYPDLFIYDNSLRLTSLVYSSITPTALGTSFSVYKMISFPAATLVSDVTPTLISTSTPTDLITGVTITPGQTLIVLKGNAVSNYTFTISNP